MQLGTVLLFIYIDGAWGTYGRQERCIQGLVGRPEGKRTLGRRKRRWEDNIERDLQEVEWERRLN